MKKIAMSLVTIAAVALMAVGATGAYFSDTVTLTDNTFSSDSLKLTVNGTHNGATQTFHVSNLHPGYNSQIGRFVLENTGTMDGSAWMEVKNLQITGDDAPALGDVLHLAVSRENSGITYGYTEMLNQENGLHLSFATLAPAATLPLLMNLNWVSTSEASDNLAQGQTATFDVVFHLDQIH